MALAVDGLSSRLRVYGAARRRPEMQLLLLRAVDEMKTSCVSAEELFSAASTCGGSLGDKLSDMALIAEAYDAVAANGRADPADRLTRLAESLPGAGFGENSSVYIDGFIDFTAQERRVVEALLRIGASVTVCLTLSEDDAENEAFAPSRTAARRLRDMAKTLGAETETVSFSEETVKPRHSAFRGQYVFLYLSSL